MEVINCGWPEKTRLVRCLFQYTMAFGKFSSLALSVPYTSQRPQVNNRSCMQFLSTISTMYYIIQQYMYLLAQYNSSLNAFTYSCFHLTSPDKISAITNKYGAVETFVLRVFSDYTWYYDVQHPSKLINIQFTSYILQNAGWRVYMGRTFHPTSLISHLWVKVGSHLTGLAHFPCEHEIIFPIKNNKDAWLI